MLLRRPGEAIWGIPANISIDELQADLDRWMEEYNEIRPHHGRWCYEKTPMQTFRDSIGLAKEKMIAAE